MLSSSYYPYHHQVNQDTTSQEIDASSSYDCSTAITLDLEQAECYDTDSTLNKMQWRSWQEEVRHLLLFAGLLSAIVTPFIIESNKKLKSNSEHAVAFNLLSHIATMTSRENDTVDPLTRLPIPIPPLAPAAQRSYIRANTFWLISLVLSLTTILIGSLLSQWLRACQSSSCTFPMLSSLSSHSPSSPSASACRQPTTPLLGPLFTSNKFTNPNLNLNSINSKQLEPHSSSRFTSKFNPNRPGPITVPVLEIRRIRILLATLPLLLQLAVVLFLGGLMDYVQVFGDCGVWVSVGVVFVFVGFIFRTVVMH